MSGENNTVDMGELAKAFGGDKEGVKKSKDEMEKELKKEGDMTKKSSKSKGAIAFFAIGMIALVAGAAFMIVKLMAGPSKADAEFLISAGEWTREGENTVVWDFTETGKGSLTTDGHQNDYNFIWAIDGNKLKIETDWLYDLNDEFEYQLDQGSKTLTLKSPDGKEIKFKA